MASEVMLYAFPGAEGYGRVSVGGRSGVVIHVTNLNSSGPGSLYEACRTPGKRIIVFDVAGVIYGDIEITHSNITIAGQSAPAPGITLNGRIIAKPATDERLHDIIIRYLRVRPPPTTGVSGDAIQLPSTDRVILDHLSLSWANDEVIDIIYSSNFTLQWSTVEESDPAGHAKGVSHNFAILSAYPGSGNISIHHNLFANHSRRSPSLSPGEKGMPGEFTNNIVYNFSEGLGHDGHVPQSGINLIANYYKRGPESNIIVPFNFDKDGKYYLSGNYIEGYGFVINPQSVRDGYGWIKMITKGQMLSEAVKTDNIQRHDAFEAYHLVVLNAGAFPRDRVTKRTLTELKTNSGRWYRNADATPDTKWFMHGMPIEAKIIDRDYDGMNDIWEKQNGLNPADPNDYLQVMNSGYTAIEEYLNYRAEHVLTTFR